MVSKVLVDHVDLRVSSVTRALPFYDALFGVLGRVRISDAAATEWAGWAWTAPDDDEAPIPSPFIGIMHDGFAPPGASRLAFHAASREIVDLAARTVAGLAARNLEEPHLCTEYSPTYYATFFEDPDGNRLEVCCRV